ncbi:AAA family ATPase [Flavobacterium tyrosinilyticum]|uniref:AAA family ATPase n=1 Tax=Flavobacterium tyrosinilyticum TaxID=1658740 RepID=UPI00202DD9A7|nr:AAA family ATPase [Flavobacterium tyrosinilyticum]MCM0666622.1 ATP-binding protein [Flavobacterium tyrosinilyticum]
MEKLIVKNFGPIKEAEIDLTKYVVFIGDTSTGKSVLAKLITIFRDNDLTFGADRIGEFNRLLGHYNIGFDTEESSFEYIHDNLRITISKNDLKSRKSKFLFTPTNDTKKKIEKDSLIDLNNKINEILNNENNQYADRVVDDLKKMIKQIINIDKSLHSSPIYIPAERILVSMLSSSISGLWANNVALPNCFKDFSARYEVARKEIKELYFESFGINFKWDNESEYVKIEEKEYVLSKTSSGIQSLLPLLLVLEYEINYSDSGEVKTILMEEPELNLFPIKQKNLINYLVEKIKETKNNLVITTHSPYILSSLDTLILAKNTFNEHTDLKEEINLIVSENKWVDYDEISVYEVRNDGKVYSIKNEEFRSIDTNAIDGVSDIISDEFDKLTELRYAQ